MGNDSWMDNPPPTNRGGRPRILTNADLDKILRARKKGWTVLALAEKFGVGERTLFRRIKTRLAEKATKALRNG